MGGSVPENPPTEGSEKEAAGEGPAREGPSHRTPDESTVGLASVAPPAPVPSDNDDVARLQVGELLAGRFSVLRFIAQGGMGAVYEATDVLLRTRVALKVIRGQIVTDATAMERFRSEVLLARRLSHPNVCRLYELYEATTARGIPIHFLTMELLGGESLARRLARNGRMTTEEALPIVRKMCDGLEAAHAEGVIHRDFKSSNVMLVPRASTGDEQATESTRVVITDFGVASALRLATEEPEEGPLTGQGILGTREYMAPEQVTGSQVTVATDIYALGIVMYEMVTGKLPFAGDTPLAAAARRLDEPPPRPETTVPGLDKRWAAVILRCLARQPDKRFKNARDVIPALDIPRRRSRRALPFALSGALLLVLGAYGVVKYRPTLRVRGPEKKAALTAPRLVVAVLGIRNELASPKLEWLPTAVTELLAHELAAAETSLRVSDTDWADLDRRSLGVLEDDVSDEKTQRRLQALLGANVLVYGSLSPREPASDDVRLRVQVLDAQPRKDRGVFDEDLGPNGARLTEAVPQLAGRIRTALGASLTDEQEAALSASRAHNLDAAQEYAEGVRRQRLWELEDARSHLEAALTADPGFLDAQRRIGQTWRDQGNTKRARQVAERMRARTSGLTARQTAQLDTAILGFEPDEEKATDAWTALFDAMPDDFEVGASLLEWLPLRAQPVLIKRLRQLPAYPALRLDLREAEAVWDAGETQRASELLGGVAQRARELGARWELARVRQSQGWRLYRGERRFTEALEALREAERLYAEVGELDKVAQTKSMKALLLSEMGSEGDYRAALDEAAGAFRRLGKHRAGAFLLTVSGQHQLLTLGDVDAARRRLEEARAEHEALEEPPGGFHRLVRAQLALSEADLAAAQATLREDEGQWALVHVGLVLYERDDRQEARSIFLKAASRGEQIGDGELAGVGVLACLVDCDGGQASAGLACLMEKCPKPLSRPHLVLVAQCKYRLNDLAGAERAARDSLPAEGGRAYENEAMASAILMSVAATRGDSARSIRVLKEHLADAESKHNKRVAYELALALGNVELKAGRPEGRKRLLKLQEEAKSREHLRIARLVREALDQKPASAGTH